MPRSNREYLLRYADQAINDLERGLDRLQMLSDAYGGVYKPMENDPMPVLEETQDEYVGPHGKYQQYVDIQAQLLMTVRDNLLTFKQNYM